MKFKNPLFYIVSILLTINSIQSSDQIRQLKNRQPKIVALLPVRNESHEIRQCLLALKPYVDAIVIFDDASEDNTVEIVKQMAEECNVEKIIRRKKWHRSEPLNRSIILKAGREIGGTHFVYIDADEMFTANCMKNNFLRNKILELEPGDKLLLPWIPLWRSVDTYRVDREFPTKPFVLCDDGQCQYGNFGQYFMHTGRMPKNNIGKNVILKEYGVLHFQAVNIKNMGIRETWYRCIEKIRYEGAPTERLNKRYKFMTDEKGLQLKECPKNWYEGYDFFDKTAFEKVDIWRKNQIYKWFDTYGFELFADLDLSGLDENQFEKGYKKFLID